MQQSTSANTYLTTAELAELIKYDVRTIRNRLKDSVLLEGVHYIRPFGRRKILFIRAAIERDIALWSTGLGSEVGTEPVNTADGTARRKPSIRHGTRNMVHGIPMAAGGVCHV